METPLNQWPKFSLRAAGLGMVGNLTLGPALHRFALIRSAPDRQFEIISDDAIEKPLQTISRNFVDGCDAFQNTSRPR